MLMKTPLYVTFALFLAFGAVRSEAAVDAKIVAGNKALWPQRVTVKRQAQADVVENGNVLMKMTVEANSNFPVKIVTEQWVELDVEGTFLRVPIGDTDILEQAQTRANAGFDKMSGAAANNPLLNKVGADLVVLQNGQFVPCNATRVANAKYVGIYFARATCSSCQDFTPELVKFYNQTNRGNFEVVFASVDENEQNMAAHMKQQGMTWPAITHAKVQTGGIGEYAGSGVPCLVLVDANGKVVSHSFVNGEYLGPEKVLADAGKLVAR